MKKSMMLGVNSQSQRCCKLLCLLPFDKLVASEVEAEDFTHSATNWDGCDDIERTLGFIGMKRTGRKITLGRKITFHGTDYDMGHYYNWQFSVDEIYELSE